MQLWASQASPKPKSRLGIQSTGEISSAVTPQLCPLKHFSSGRRAPQSIKCNIGESQLMLNLITPA